MPLTTLAQLETIAKPEKANKLYDYLQHKQTGGTNNAKGNKFEAYFTVFKIANLWDKDPGSIFFSAQEFCFVDDLVIRLIQRIEHYQIKDIINISWKTGPHTLADDFTYQMNLYRINCKKARLYMIVSGKSLCTRLRNSGPVNLRKIVTVKQFPAATSIGRLLTMSGPFRDAITSLCGLTNPRMDKLETIAAQILGQWEISDKTDISLGHLKDQCLTSSPHFFKGGANHVSAPLDALLRSINGLTFNIKSGILEWSFNGSDTGSLSFKIGSAEFAQFENAILNFSAGTAFQTVEHLFL
jgi:hypothetical protein